MSPCFPLASPQAGMSQRPMVMSVPQVILAAVGAAVDIHASSAALHEAGRSRRCLPVRVGLLGDAIRPDARSEAPAHAPASRAKPMIGSP